MKNVTEEVDNGIEFFSGMKNFWRTGTCVKFTLIDHKINNVIELIMIMISKSIEERVYFDTQLLHSKFCEKDISDDMSEKQKVFYSNPLNKYMQPEGLREDTMHTLAASYIEKRLAVISEANIELKIMALEDDSLNAEGVLDVLCSKPNNLNMYRGPKETGTSQRNGDWAGSLKQMYPDWTKENFPDSMRGRSLVLKDVDSDFVRSVLNEKIDEGSLACTLEEPLSEIDLNHDISGLNSPDGSDGGMMTLNIQPHHGESIVDLEEEIGRILGQFSLLDVLRNSNEKNNDDDNDKTDASEDAQKGSVSNPDRDTSCRQETIRTQKNPPRRKRRLTVQLILAPSQEQGDDIQTSTNKEHIDRSEVNLSEVLVSQIFCRLLLLHLFE
mmetsp:Transcript_34466/g.32834  ORF Transcript_34466/g.32834 Transcript_34466/m.32834 type:complete len:384 (+) Transcript_34466:270-1421(+)